MLPQDTTIPAGFCHCGCGERAPLAPYSSAKIGWVKGQPVRYLHAHHLGAARATRWANYTRIVDRFWSLTQRRDTCLEWLGFRDRKDYGRLMFQGKKHLAHRVAYELTYGIGSIPSHLELLHLCPGGGNPWCVEPTHLRPGTSAENTAMMFEHHRNPGKRGRTPATCKAGHFYDDTNTSYRRDGSRRCRTCHRLQETKRYRIKTGGLHG